MTKVEAHIKSWRELKGVRVIKCSGCGDPLTTNINHELYCKECREFINFVTDPFITDSK